LKVHAPRPGRRGVLAALAAGVGGTGASAASAAPALTFDLWSGSPPGSPPQPPAERIVNRSADPTQPDRILTGVARPRLDYYPAALPTGAAVVVAPGGGYVRIALDKEGVDIGQWLSARGVAVFVLTYRLPGDGWNDPGFVAVADAQRAMRWVRFHAARFGVDPHRVGLIGFSAGGHVAAGVIADEEKARYAARDPMDMLAIRPDLVALFYPVLDMSTALAHPVSRQTLLEASRLPEGEAEIRFSPNRRVPASPPPAFLCCALDDPSVPPENTLAMLTALRAQGGRVEAHLFEKGGHGFGIRKAAGLPAAAWPELLRAWMSAVGFLGR